MARKFLTAAWRKLAMANYAIDPKALLPFLPAKTELDLWNDTCYISLVGFMFLKTKLLGMPIPFHQNFEEVNLRFYVRYKDGAEWKRGVVFIKEIVPKYAISWVANAVYGEHYQTLPMRHDWTETATNWSIKYEWKFCQDWHSFHILADKTPQELVQGSEEEFITEHYWGYTRQSATKTAQYQVEHPSWQWYNVQQYDIQCDATNLYGAAFGEAMQQAPMSVFLAEGSDIIVRMGGKI